MKASTGVAMGAAILGGYALGRTRKGRLALVATAAVMGAQASLRGRKIPLISAPIDLAAREAGRLLRDTATTALTNRAERLSDALHERTVSLRQVAEPPEEDDDEQDQEETAEPEESESNGSAARSRAGSAPRQAARRTGRPAAAQRGGGQ